MKKGILVSASMMISLGISAQMVNVARIWQNGRMVSQAQVDSITFAKQRAYVDLGLPTKTLWATTNLGAEKPTDIGDYFAWGETTTKSTFSWTNYKHSFNGSPSVFKKYDDRDNEICLQAGDDVAKNFPDWDEGWRVPTQDEVYELILNTYQTWQKMDGVPGVRFENIYDSSKWIFLPAAGYKSDNGIEQNKTGGFYWTAELLNYNSARATSLSFIEPFGTMSSAEINSMFRKLGCLIRPVRK